MKLYNKESRRNWGWKHEKPYNSRIAYVSESCDLPKFPLKRHLSTGAWTKTLAPSIRAKNRKKTITQKLLTSAKLVITRMSAIKTAIQRYLNRGSSSTHLGEMAGKVPVHWISTYFHQCDFVSSIQNISTQSFTFRFYSILPCDWFVYCSL